MATINPPRSWFPFFLVIALIVVSVLTFFNSLTVLKTRLANDKKTIEWPNSFAKLKSLESTILFLITEEFTHSLLFFCSFYLIKQTFSIPGSALLNIAAGVMFRMYIAFPLICILATMGASCCFIISRQLSRRFVTKCFPDKLKTMEETIMKHRDNLIFYLIFLRLVPMTPNWFLNIASPIVNIPLLPFAISIFVGLMPYHFICSRAGSIISSIESMDDIFSWSVILQLLFLAALSVVPIIIKRRSAAPVDTDK